jgi:hypothetical protein
VTKSAPHHPRGGSLERPIGRRVHHVGGEVPADDFVVDALPGLAYGLPARIGIGAVCWGVGAVRSARVSGAPTARAARALTSW